MIAMVVFFFTKQYHLLTHSQFILFIFSDGDYDWHSSGGESRKSYRVLVKQSDPLQVQVIVKLLEDEDTLSNCNHVLVFGRPAYDAVKKGKAWAPLRDVFDDEDNSAEWRHEDFPLPHPTVVIMRWLRYYQRERLLNTFQQLWGDLLGVDSPQLKEVDMQSILPIRPKKPQHGVVTTNFFGTSVCLSPSQQRELESLSSEEKEDAEERKRSNRKAGHEKRVADRYSDLQDAGQEHIGDYFCSKCNYGKTSIFNAGCRMVKTKKNILGKYKRCTGVMNQLKNADGNFVSHYVYGVSSCGCTIGICKSLSLYCSCCLSYCSLKYSWYCPCS